MSISRINQSVHFVNKTTEEAGPRTPEKLSESANNFQKMLNHAPHPNGTPHMKHARHSHLRMRHGRSFRQRQAARQAGRRRQIERGKQKRKSEGMAGQEIGSDDSLSDVSMESSAGDSNSSDTREQMDGLLKQKQRKERKKRALDALPDFILQGFLGEKREKIGSTSESDLNSGTDRDDRGGKKTWGGLDEEDEYEDSGPEGVMSDWSDHPVLSSDYEELTQAVAGQIDRNLMIIERLAGEVVAAGTSMPFEKEIRLRIKDELLEATHMRVMIIDKTLSIDFRTTSENSYQWLKNHRDELEKYVLQGFELEIEENKKRQKNSKSPVMAKIKIIMDDKSEDKSAVRSSEHYRYWRPT